MKHIAHPIIGDATYGKGPHNRAIAAFSDHARLLLACVGLQLQHPETGAALIINCPLAADFEASLQRMGLAAQPTP